MSPRTTLALLVCVAVGASFEACSSPEPYHAKSSALAGQAGTNGQGSAGTTGMAGSGTGVAGDTSGTAGNAGVAGDTSGTAGSATAGDNGMAGTGMAGSTAGTTGMAGSTAGTTGMAGSAAGMAGSMAGMAGSTAGSMAGSMAGMAGSMAGSMAGTTGAAGTTGPVIKIDSAGTAMAPWVADVDFTGGNNGQVNNGAVDVTGVTNPATQTVYQTTRIGVNFSYTVPGYPANSNQTVRLHFCETYFPPPGDTMGGANRRTCNVTINGKQVLTNYDIFAKAGAKMKAVVEQFNEPANAQGQFVIQFMATKDNCAIGGIEIQ
jgi:hypothetical protein